MNARNQTDFLPLAGMLEVAGVGVEVPGRSLLQAVSAQFIAGQVTAVLGPNGAGKSTLMSLLTGQRQPSGGHVHLAGKALSAHAPAELARMRACVAQETQVAFEFTVREVVELGRYPHRRHPGRNEADVVLQAMQATAVEHLQHRVLNTLSGGEKARVHLARALAQVWEPLAGQSTRWLLLDEPTAALDLQHQHRMLQLVRAWATAQGVGVVAVLHDLNLALRYSDRCVVLQQGRVVGSGATAEVLTPLCIEKVWGVVAHPVAQQGEALGPRQYLFEAPV
ncbi:heme ABC transporter ATP-binding protein [Polaromonas sp. JS666]|uniref:heme ABC transporter ATP-binding protein n=1 Tax=Polaromonas sp. (strain JS666 / ATCC BAA-500) TaxID=296591 RepID=UPI000891AD3B|nr:heme ABC transporter ATP-binding protein [Polaromonas sp. JS666]SDM56214.1 iron complex transport system ATP-binding protein [Polaromonas sp. JS666]